MTLLEEAIISLYEDHFAVWEIAIIVDCNMNYVHDVLDYYYGW